jgi:hypothetical protein
MLVQTGSYVYRNTRNIGSKEGRTYIRTLEVLVQRSYILPQHLAYGLNMFVSASLFHERRQNLILIHVRSFPLAGRIKHYSITLLVLFKKICVCTSEQLTKGT